MPLWAPPYSVPLVFVSGPKQQAHSVATEELLFSAFIALKYPPLPPFIFALVLRRHMAVSPLLYAAQWPSVSLNSRGMFAVFVT